MLEVLTKYLASKIPLYRELDPTPLIVDSLMDGGLFTNKGGVLGLSKISENLWEVLFFAADSKDDRKELVRQAGEKLGKISIKFFRPKHKDREIVHTFNFWVRLA